LQQRRQILLGGRASRWARATANTQGGLARNISPEQHTAAQAASWKLPSSSSTSQQGDTILLGLPLYNFGPPSSVKAWVDHVVARGLSLDSESGEGLLVGRKLAVTPAMSTLIRLARRSRADAEQAVDNLWSPAAMAE
jgi:putative NADPH-quinone reductase